MSEEQLCSLPLFCFCVEMCRYKHGSHMRKVSRGGKKDEGGVSKGRGSAFKDTLDDDDDGGDEEEEAGEDDEEGGEDTAKPAAATAGKGKKASPKKPAAVKKAAAAKKPAAAKKAAAPKKVKKEVLSDLSDEDM